MLFKIKHLFVTQLFQLLDLEHCDKVVHHLGKDLVVIEVHQVLFDEVLVLGLCFFVVFLGFLGLFGLFVVDFNCFSLLSLVQSRVRANRFCSDVPFWCTGTGHELTHAHFWGLDGLFGLFGLVGYFKPHFTFRRLWEPSGATMMEISLSNLSISHFSR